MEPLSPEVFKKLWMWHWGTWVIGDHGGTGGMVGLVDLGGFSNLNNSRKALEIGSEGLGRGTGQELD